MDPRAAFSPGSLIPFSGRGSSNESQAVALNWAVASQGIVQFTHRPRLADFIWDRGAPPYARCSASGYLASQAAMLLVDGCWYIADFAPRSKEDL